MQNVNSRLTAVKMATRLKQIVNMKNIKSRFKTGDFVSYLNKEDAVVTQVHMNPLGFVDYHIQSFCDGKIKRASSLELYEHCGTFDWDEEVPESQEEQVSEEEPQEEDQADETQPMDEEPQDMEDSLDPVEEAKSTNKSTRFEKKTPSEIDELAESRLSKKTKSATKWSIKCFEGNSLSKSLSNIQ